jgi:hypothetical protein
MDRRECAGCGIHQELPGRIHIVLIRQQVGF